MQFVGIPIKITKNFPKPELGYVAEFNLPNAMQKYRCTYCEYIYDPVSGDPEHNVGRYTPFDALPDDWVCPVCGRGKWAFDAMKEQKTNDI